MLKPMLNSISKFLDRGLKQTMDKGKPYFECAKDLVDELVIAEEQEKEGDKLEVVLEPISKGGLSEQLKEVLDPEPKPNTNPESGRWEMEISKDKRILSIKDRVSKVELSVDALLDIDGKQIPYAIAKGNTFKRRIEVLDNGS